MSHQVHGMAGNLTEPVWDPLTEREVREILTRYPVTSEHASITWRSPRPMSAAALVDVAGRPLFVKRHSPHVRTIGQIGVEHELARWLRRRGQPVPDVLVTAAGETVVEGPLGLYEVQEAAPGEDRYRHALSWTPYHSSADATAAGAALARLHLAAEEFPRPAHPLGVLTDSSVLITAPDPLAAVGAHIGSRPVLARYLQSRDWKAELSAALGPALERAASADVAGAAPLWTHGDWHPSNLSWTGSAVVGVFDLGLSNRTYAMHDLAVAIERSCVDWLVTGRKVDGAALRSLLAGYDAVRPLCDQDRQHLFATLRVAHVEYALSEIEYFAGPADTPADAELAYGYLCRHAAGDAWADVERIGQKMP